MASSHSSGYRGAGCRVRHNYERGQAVLLFLATMSIVLLGMLGFAIDLSRMYVQYQLVQAAADAAAQAAVSSVYHGTNTGSNAYGSSTVTCTSTSTITPCQYASLNGFSASYGDTVKVDFPSSVSGVTLSASYSPSAVRMTIIRPVPTTLMRVLGVSNWNVAAQGTAGILGAPNVGATLQIMDPKLPDALNVQGTPDLRICGGGSTAIQVDSCAGGSCSGSEAWYAKGSANIDISHAGPKDDGTCATGTGAAFASNGPGSGTGAITKGTSGSYAASVSPASDPYASVPAPSSASLTNNPATCTVNVTAPFNACQSGQTYGCTSTCTLYYPGAYSSGISLGSHATAVLAPGIYYMSSGGLSVASGANLTNATGMTGDTNTGQGVLFYITGGSTLNVQGGGTVNLTGTPVSSIYEGILFFGDRSATGVQSETITGGGSMNLNGITYLTETNADASNYYQLNLGGNGSLTASQVVVDSMQMKGTSEITIAGADQSAEISTAMALIK